MESISCFYHWVMERISWTRSQDVKDKVIADWASQELACWESLFFIFFLQEIGSRVHRLEGRSGLSCLYVFFVQADHGAET